MKKALILASVASMIEQFNMDNINILQKQGYQVDVMANFENAGTIDNKRLEEFKKELDKINVQYFHIPFKRNPLSSKNIKAYTILKRMIKQNQYNLVHMHSPIGGLCGRLACKKLRKTGTKVIYTAHGFHFYKGAPIINWLIYYPFEKYLARYTDVLITINREDYDIASKKFKSNKIHLVHGVGVDINKFDIKVPQEEKEKIMQSIGLNKDDKILIYVAELSKRKNQDMAIKVIKELIKLDDKVKLLLVGKDSLDRHHKKLVDEYQIEEHVKFLSYRKDIPILMNISDLVISTSLQEGLPVNIMEAMASSLPVVATDCRGNRDLVINNETGYITKIDDIEDFTNKVNELIKDNKKAELFSKSAREKIEQYSLENISQIMYDLYKKI